ncbi:hypothetical protein OHA40_23390 [Nocardia sp. NBC_00508]|uniref:hypothetical protein n=1 Tax=Nocardia sp. NBC_00508 TaxID=2975992 RepID=UPI002E80504A|nr:hypothetical protein [Nocardia sp. NBC_00508]WUD64614.1 hypothetical protein OHA40_23390 [Nocardia sp. NBC_00508]
MPENTTTGFAAYGCGPECEPWISVSHCGVFAFDNKTGDLLSVKCPSYLCCGQMVPIINGRMTDHDFPAGIAFGGQKCPWIGIRVVDDRAPSSVLAPDQPPQAAR